MRDDPALRMAVAGDAFLISWNSTMRRLLTLALGIIALFCMLSDTARAMDYPWCVASGSGLEDCSFTTFAQCQAAASGTGACYPNPRAARR
jgi:hypothetical protein